MHANDVGAFQNSSRDRGEGAVETLLNWSGRARFVGEQAADKGLARGADQEWVVGEGGD